MDPQLSRIHLSIGQSRWTTAIIRVQKENNKNAGGVLHICRKLNLIGVIKAYERFMKFNAPIAICIYHLPLRHIYQGVNEIFRNRADLQCFIVVICHGTSQSMIHATVTISHTFESSITQTATFSHIFILNPLSVLFSNYE